MGLPGELMNISTGADDGSVGPSCVSESARTGVAPAIRTATS